MSHGLEQNLSENQNGRPHRSVQRGAARDHAQDLETNPRENTGQPRPAPWRR